MNGDPTTSSWYYFIAGTSQAGPFAWEELQALAQTAAFSPTDFVWSPGFPDWVPAKQVAGLFEATAAPAEPLRVASSAEAADTAARAVPATRLARPWLPAAVLALAALLVAAGVGIYFGVTRDGQGGEPAASSNVAGPPATALPLDLTWTKLNAGDGLPLVRAGQSMVYDL